MPGPRKFDPRKDIFIDPRFLSQGVPNQKYSLSAWNRSREKEGLPRVYPPQRLVSRWSHDIMGNPVGVTHRPMSGNTSYIPYERAFHNTKLVDMIDKHNEINSSSNTTSITSTTSTRRPDNEADSEIRKLYDLFDDYGIDEFFKDQENPDDILILPSVSGQGTQLRKPKNKAGPKDRVKNPNKKQKVTGSTSSVLTSTIPGSISTSEMVHTRSGPHGDENDMEHSGTIESPISENPTESGHNAASDGGFDSAQGPRSYIAHCDYNYSAGHRTYEKTHRFRSHAIPFYWPASATGSNARPVITPLAYIPVDKIWMYMSEREFNLIPVGSHIVDCSARIQVLNSSTIFQTGGSTSELVSAQHVRTGMIGVDLDKKFRGGGINRITIADDMTPSIAGSGFSSVAFQRLQYGSWPGNNVTGNTWDVSSLPGCAYGIPYNTNSYFCLFQMNQAGYTAAGIGAANSMGHEYFTSGITEFNLNDKLWDDVIHYKYKFKSAPIGYLPVSELKDIQFDQLIGHDNHYNLKRNVNTIDSGSHYGNEIVNTDQANFRSVAYDDNCIEKGGINRIGSAVSTPARQPTLYFGMRAIPKASVSVTDARADEWVNAFVEYIVSVKMTVKLPESPNRFTQPATLNVSLENAPTGSVLKSDYNNDYGTNGSTVTYGLKDAH